MRPGRLFLAPVLLALWASGSLGALGPEAPGGRTQRRGSIGIDPPDRGASTRSLSRAPLSRAPLSRAPSLLDLLDATDLSGQLWNRTRLEGRVVVLDFWASWCAPCLSDFPHLRSLHADLAPEVVVLGVSVERTAPSTFRSFLDRQGVDWPQIWDGRGFDGDLVRGLEVTSVPRTLLFDREGRLVGVDLRGAGLRAAVRALAGRGPSPSR